jgi:hypothetical protein
VLAEVHLNSGFATIDPLALQIGYVCVQRNATFMDGMHATTPAS